MSLRHRSLRLGAALACSLASALAIPSAFAHPPGHHGPDPVAHLADSLGLSDTQKASIQSVFDAQFKPALQNIHDSARASSKTILDGVMQQVQTKLTPALTAEQQQDLASLQRARAARESAASARKDSGAPGHGPRHFRGFGGPGEHGGHGKFDPSSGLATALGLTDAQKSQVQSFFDAVRPQLKSIHDDARTQSKALMARFHTQIAQYLTPQQQQDLASMQRIQQRVRSAHDAARTGKDS